MIAVDPILDFLSICIWTASIQDEEAVSVVLVSESSAGKTSMLKMLQCPISKFLTDMTTRDISNVMADQQKRIILLSDMQAIFSHKSTVVNTCMQALRNLLAEGVYNDPYSGAEVQRRFGMITGIPPKEFNKVSSIFMSGGLDTRFLIFAYEYKKKTISRIHDSIEHGAKKEKPFKIKLPETGEIHKVELNGKVSRQCRNLAAVLKRDDIGLRIHHQIRSLVMACAARAGRKVATMGDFETIAGYTDFLEPNRPTRVTL